LAWLTARGKDPVRIHEVRLTGLEIEKEYHYRVLSGPDRSVDLTFHTAVRPETPFTFVYYGDNKNGPHMHRKNALAILGEKPHIVLQCGDLVNRGDVYSQWERLFFTPAAPLISRVPLFPSLGNHEENGIKDPVAAIELAEQAEDIAEQAEDTEDKSLAAKALEMFSKAFEQDPTFAEALVEVGKVNRLLGKEDLAVEQFRKAMEILPIYPDSYEELTDVLIERRAFEEALATAQRWAEVEPDQADPQEAMAEIRGRQGQPELAVGHLVKALEIVPSDSGVHSDLAELYAKLGRRAEAMAHFKQAIQWMDFEDTEAIQGLVDKMEALERARVD